MKKDMVTTAIALLNMIVFIGLVIALIFDYVDKGTFYEILAVMGTVSVSALGYFAKDKEIKKGGES